MKALEVAEHLIRLAQQDEPSGGEPMSNLKLQKLLYYEQGYHLAAFGSPLFDEEIEAWMYGPVVPVVYEHYKNHKSEPLLPSNGRIDLTLADEEKRFFIEVYDTYKIYSAFGLTTKTHEEMPWRSVPAQKGSIITKESMKAFFKTLIED